MFLEHKKLVPGGMILVLFLLLVACSSAGSDSNNRNTGTGSTQDRGSTSSASAVATITPQLVTPKSASGSAGIGPLVISSPTPVPGGKAGSQQVVLGNRTTRSGTIEFEVPTAATSGLRLLYRPEIAKETAIILLKIA